MMSIKAISFDLDDTLWPILPIINKAEEITNKWLVKNYPGVEKLLKGKELADISNKLLEKRKDLSNNLSKIKRIISHRTWELDLVTTNRNPKSWLHNPLRFFTPIVIKLHSTKALKGV